MNKIFGGIIPAILILCGVGCTRFDYYGQSFEPTGDDRQIKIAWNQADISPDEYRAIGRGVLSVSAHCDRFDIDEKLESYARSYGADAVSVIKVESVSRGVFERDEHDFDTTKAPEPSPDDPTFGKEINPQAELHGRQEKDVYVRLWKNRADVEDILSKREAQLKKKMEGNWRGDE